MTIVAIKIKEDSIKDFQIRQCWISLSRAGSFS